MQTTRFPAIIALVAVFALAAPDAQAPAKRLSVSSAVSAAVGDGGPESPVSVAGRFQFAPNVGIELEGLYIGGQEFEHGFASPQIFPSLPSSELVSRVHTLAFLSSLVTNVELGWFRPYALVGGVANLRQRVSVASGVVSPEGEGRSSLDVRNVGENSLALAAGGGLEYRIWRELDIGDWGPSRVLVLERRSGRFDAAEAGGTGPANRLTRRGAWTRACLPCQQRSAGVAQVGAVCACG